MGNQREAQSSDNSESCASQLPYIEGNDVIIDLTSNADIRTETDNITSSESQQTIDGRITTELESGNESESARNQNEIVNEGRRRNLEETKRYRLGIWPHRTSSLLACLCCVVGMYSINRFSLQVYIYKVTFIFQYIILSLVFGIPFLYLQMALGQYMGTGILDMWYISPAFKGLGIAFLFMFFFIGVYTAVPISWLFVYFKDSFVNTRDNYRWTRCQPTFSTTYCLRARNMTSPDYYGWSVASYFHGHVLERKPDNYEFGELKFEISFNLCIVWLLVFMSLCRGPKTLGKVILVLGIMPSVLLLLVTMRMVEQWGEGIIDIFPISWKVSMTNSQSWLVAAREVFLNWGLFGAIAFHLCSHNKFNTNLNRNIIILSVSGTSILIISSLLFASVMNTLQQNGLLLLPTSYEEIENVSPNRVRNMSLEIKKFQKKLVCSVSKKKSEENVRVLQRTTPKSQILNVTMVNYIVGNGFILPKQSRAISGYQTLRFATEVFPASLAVEGVQRISSFWSICFYTMMVLFGLGQQIVIWSCVVESFISIKYKLLKSWQTTVTFITCNIAFLLGLPMTSNVGIYIIFFMDFSFGSLWWIVALYMSMMVAVLFVRGRKYGTDKIISMLSQQSSSKNWILSALTFQWNVVLPVSFLVLFITFLRSSEFESKFPWTEPVENYASWPLWIRRLTVWFQVTSLLIVCAQCAYQGLLYLVPRSDLTFSQRIQAWCCPVIEIEPPVEPESQNSSEETSQGIVNNGYVDDPPPKYTPPPSYSTATSRMVVKELNVRHNEEAENAIRTVSGSLQRILEDERANRY